MKVCAYLPQIPNFEFDARSVPMILEHSNFYPSVFTPIHILFKVLRKFLKKKTFFRYTLVDISKNGPIMHKTVALREESKIFRGNQLTQDD